MRLVHALDDPLETHLRNASAMRYGDLIARRCEMVCSAGILLWATMRKDAIPLRDDYL
jgi:hypothetical protein